MGASPPIWPAINVIHRIYKKGGQIKPHVDRPKFTETVYTTVLSKKSAVGLQMTSPDGRETILGAGEHFLLVFGRKDNVEAWRAISPVRREEFHQLEILIQIRRTRQD